MSDLVTLIIDEQKVTVPKGTLVIEAATQLGIDVPRFCYHPKLSAVGMCRMCLGEVGMPKMNPDRTPALKEDGTPEIAMMPKPQTLCTMQASEGMYVLTETPAVVDMREGMLEFFLANHPLDCPICDKGGECMLQDQTMAYAEGLSRVQDMYHLRKDLAKDYPLSPLISLDQERCIQCARCTRFCDEVAQDPVLELFNRGSKTLIGTVSDPPFDTKFSGNTMDICPVGALTSRSFRFKARVWELNNVPTVSMMDGSGTNIFVGQRNETLIRIIPRDNESINECWISDRDRFGLEWVDNDARLTFPLVRRGEFLEPATWDEALQLVADKLQSTPAERIGAVGSPKLTNEGALAMSKLFREAVLTSNLDHEWRPTITTPGRPPASFYEELEAADTILVVGANPNEELPILDLRLKKAAFQRKAQLINCNAYKTPLDQLAKQSLQYNEGTEVSLLNALAKLAHQSWSQEPAQTEKLKEVGEQSGASAWIDSLAGVASGKVAETTGVAESDLRAAAAAIAQSNRLFLLIGEDAAPETLVALQNLAALKGRSDYLVVLHPGANELGVRRAGLVPGEGGRSGAQMLEAAAGGTLEVLFVAATNPLNHAEDEALARRAIENAGFLVVQSLFENELTAHADVVLPAASFLEQDGTTTNFHGKVQSLKQAFRPRERRDDEGNTLSACAPDWIIFTKLAQLLGHDTNVRRIGDLTQEFKTLPRLESAIPHFAQVNGGTEYSDAPEGRLRLLTGPLQYDGGESFEYSPLLNLVVPEPFVQINRRDAQRLSIERNALVEVQTERGTVQVRAKVGRQTKEGTVWMPRRLRDVQMNKLMQSDGSPTFVTINKIEDAPEKAQATAETESKVAV